MSGCIYLGDNLVKTSAVGLPWEKRDEISSTQYSNDQAQNEFFTEAFDEVNASSVVKKESSELPTSTQDHLVSNWTSPRAMIESVATNASQALTEEEHLKENSSFSTEKHEGTLATNLSNPVLSTSESTNSHIATTTESSALHESFGQSSTSTPPAPIPTENATETLSFGDANRMTAPHMEANDAHNPLAHYIEADQAWLSADTFESETAFDEFSIDPCQFLTDQVNHYLPFHVSRHMMHEFAVRYDFGHLNDYRYITIEKQVSYLIVTLTLTGIFLTLVFVTFRQC